MSPSVVDFPGWSNAQSPAQPLPSPASGVSVWHFPLERKAEETARLRQWLAPDELARMQRFGTPALAQRYVAGRSMVRWLLAQFLGVSPAAVALRRGERGRPEIAADNAPDFNLSHTLGTAFLGLSATAGQRIGVDIEHGERAINAGGIARKFMAESERSHLAQIASLDLRRRALLRLWTCKEAMSKATGDALSAPFRDIELTLSPVVSLLTGPAPYTAGDWTLHVIPMPGDFIATVALWNPQSGTKNADAPR